MMTYPEAIVTICLGLGGLATGASVIKTLCGNKTCNLHNPLMKTIEVIQGDITTIRNKLMNLPMEIINIIKKGE